MQRRPEISRNDTLSVELAQNVQIIETLTRALVVTRDTTVSSFSARTVSRSYAQISMELILQHQFEAVPHFAGRDGIAGGNVILSGVITPSNSVSILDGCPQIWPRP